MHNLYKRKLIIHGNCIDAHVKFTYVQYCTKNTFATYRLLKKYLPLLNISLFSNLKTHYINSHNHIVLFSMFPHNNHVVFECNALWIHHQQQNTHGCEIWSHHYNFFFLCFFDTI